MPRSGPITEGRRRAVLYNICMLQDALPMTPVQDLDTLTHDNRVRYNWVYYNTRWLDEYLKKPDAFQGFFNQFWEA